MSECDTCASQEQTTVTWILEGYHVRVTTLFEALLVDLASVKQLLEERQAVI